MAGVERTRVLLSREGGHERRYQHGRCVMLGRGGEVRKTMVTAGEGRAGARLPHHRHLPLYPKAGPSRGWETQEAPPAPPTPPSSSIDSGGRQC